MTTLTFIVDRLWYWVRCGYDMPVAIELTRIDCEHAGIDWLKVARANYPTG